MRKKKFHVFILLTILSSLFLASCASSDAGTTSSTTEISTIESSIIDSTLPIPSTHVTEETELSQITESAETTVFTEPPTVPPTEPPAETEPAFTAEQQNAINMMNHLATLVTEINASSASRVYLEEVYMSLLNNTDPSMVDSETARQYTAILNLLEEYRMIDVKRERLIYIYDQNRAQAFLSSTPDSMTILKSTATDDSLYAVLSLFGLAIDSATSYYSQTLELDTKYLQDNWSLNDIESQNLHNSRTSLFQYLVSITGSKDLPGVVTLNEEYITEFIKWKNANNIPQRIHWLESKLDTYRYFGDYWLVLAKSYFLNSDYQKCLDAVTEYEALNISFYRIDYKYAEIIPYAIVSAKETMDSDQYIDFAVTYTERMIYNSSWYDWAKQYFACQTYMDIYAISQDVTYLQKAYNLSLDTAAYLVEEQKDLNTQYLEPLTKKKATKDDTPAIRLEIEEYNDYIDYMKKVRKTELPPVYEPLRLFCELLFGLAEELNISPAEQLYVESILRERNADNTFQSIFLNQVLDNRYRFNTSGIEIESDHVYSEFDGKRLFISAEYLSDISCIVLTYGDKAISDWEVKSIIKYDEETVASFIVELKSKTISDLSYKDNTTLTIQIFSFDGDDNPITITFIVDKGLLNLSTRFYRQYEHTGVPLY